MGGRAVDQHQAMLGLKHLLLAGTSSHLDTSESCNPVDYDGQPVIPVHVLLVQPGFHFTFSRTVESHSIETLITAIAGLPLRVKSRSWMQDLPKIPSMREPYY